MLCYYNVCKSKFTLGIKRNNSKFSNLLVNEVAEIMLVFRWESVTETAHAMSRELMAEIKMVVRLPR